MSLAVLQSAEAGLIPPSSAGTKSRRSMGYDEASYDGDDTSLSASEGGAAPAMPPPTPPRQKPPPPPVGVVQQGTCLVQMPDADGRWQPVKLTASMCGSPVGSMNPSLYAPSESTLGGRSLRHARGVGQSAMSIPEDDEEYTP